MSHAGRTSVVALLPLTAKSMALAPVVTVIVLPACAVVAPTSTASAPPRRNLRFMVLPRRCPRRTYGGRISKGNGPAAHMGQRLERFVACHGCMGEQAPRFAAISKRELGVQVFQMLLHSAGTHAEQAGDLAVAQPISVFRLIKWQRVIRLKARTSSAKRWMSMASPRGQDRPRNDFFHESDRGCTDACVRRYSLADAKKRFLLPPKSGHPGITESR